MEDRMNVLLDLDNTIINALEEHERKNISIDKQNLFDYKDLLPYGMRIYARPHLQDFLDFLFANFNVNVYTAAEGRYALFIVTNFLLTKPNRKVHNIFYRFHVDQGIQRYDATKDLRLLFNVYRTNNFYPCNTVIIDDLEDVKLANPDNTIQIKAFDVATKGGSFNEERATDTDLLRVKEILEHLNQRYKQSSCARQIYLNHAPTASSPFFL